MDADLRRQVPDNWETAFVGPVGDSNPSGHPAYPLYVDHNVHGPVVHQVGEGFWEYQPLSRSNRCLEGLGHTSGPGNVLLWDRVLQPVQAVGLESPASSFPFRSHRAKSRAESAAAARWSFASAAA